jgi:hypothetical protein
MKALVFRYSFPRLAMSRVFGLLTPRAYLGEAAHVNGRVWAQSSHLFKQALSQ